MAREAGYKPGLQYSSNGLNVQFCEVSGGGCFLNMDSQKLRASTEINE